jgi:hypothetical protein
LPETAPVELALDAIWSPTGSRDFGELLDVKVLSDGRTVLLERYEAQILVAAADGSRIDRLGGPGEGPGEFAAGGLSSLVTTDTSVLVPDLFLQRLTEFSFSGQLLGTYPFPVEGIYAVDWRRHPRGGAAFRVLKPDGDQVLRWLGEDVDTLHTFSALVEDPRLLFPAATIWDIEGEVMAYGDTHRWEVRLEHSDLNELLWIARRLVAPPPFSGADREALEDLLVALMKRRAGGADPSDETRREFMARVSFPAVRPLLAELMLAPLGEVWVRTATEVSRMGLDALRLGRGAGYGGATWHVLAANGQLDATVRLPEGFRITQMSEDWLYGIMADDLGVQRPGRIPVPE